ncbi:MAG: tetratricopeptide repeat protein [Candidatus Dormibacteria bacterium]
MGPLRSRPNSSDPLGIPVSRDRFIGRHRELEELAGVLETERLTTLTGPSGVGKTRLAGEVVGRLGQRYSEGICLVELAALADPALVASAVATALSVWEQPGHPIQETLVSRLRGRRLLVMLDNCEHVLQACSELAGALLNQCPDLSILATSQAPLAVPGEKVWPVAPLSLPEGDAGRPSDSEAVSLFCARAQAIKPGFSPDDEALALVGEICRQLDGIPLAIELAAARVSVLTLGELSSRLHQRLALLTGGSRTAAPRHQTLRAAVDWSHELLTDDERMLLRRMSVFAGGCSPEAIDAVCRGVIPDTGGPLPVAGLVTRSLVAVDAAGYETRYSMPETVRLYAAERLEAAGERASLAAAHAAWCLDLAERAEPWLTGEHQSEWLERLATDHDNLRAALRWLLAQQEIESALRLAGALTMFWRVRGHFHEGRDWLESALSGGERAPAPLRAKALWGAGFLALMLNDDAAALRMLEASRSLSRAAGDRQLEARNLLLLGNRLQFRDPAPAAELLGQSAELARKIHDTWCLAHALALVARAHLDLGEYAVAWAEIEECLSEARIARNQQSLKIGLLIAGDAALALGDHDRAGSLLEEGLAVAQQLAEPYTIASAMGRLGELATLQRRYNQARTRLSSALTIARDSGNAALVVDILCFLGQLEYAEGDAISARALFAEARRVGGEAGRPFWAVLRGLGDMARATGDFEAARPLLDEALAVATETGNQRGRAAVLSSLGGLARARDDLAASRSFHRSALELWQRIGAVPGVADGLEDLGGLAVVAGQHERAVHLFGAAQALRDARGFLRSAAREPGVATDVAAARRGTGASCFTAAWARGAAMSPAKAVAHALRGAGASSRAATGWNSLTPSELQVIQLVGEGLTNREIGLRLFLSPRTVETHLTRVFARLGVVSRRELAREVTRRSGGDPQRRVAGAP